MEQTVPAANVDDQVFCARHPEVETYLRCQTCDTPICPRCLIQTPVGAKCPDCAKVQRSVVYQVSLQHYLRGAAAGAVAGVGVGILWGLLFPPRFGFMSFFALFAGALAGYAIGEAISRAANRRRGWGLVAVAVGCVVLAYFVRTSISGDLIPSRDTTGWVMAVIAAFFASTNLR